MRTRSEYVARLPLTAATPTPTVRAEPVVAADLDALAALLLDAYRGTIDDEGEGPDEARQAIAGWWHDADAATRQASRLVRDEAGRANGHPQRRRSPACPGIARASSPTVS